ncbi:MULTISPECIES: organic hydroperoxide resistance protein [Deinococcus]|jgi:peroxiredoxin, Ohr subfamily|uniref:Organic hydroperoxide resistance protein n=1 Tax=Deinococcus radiodurans (strain ATCC 13939 / DSM 20539 / JCM 16871 / CCUG 27074 / LMG 4051 / NBRC 15346 / NCIMB 9279 / VKM B-1422 / R1) TaxID=243230 RepID=Q9RTA8_DEIRA|nr:organic hydroperoxide resistance protein [Deinococcus radiodurans]AAF11408.1 organic hydroperoxide resistance protein [Deinococcus radiodurans R1 = ATCC 13939 = DSM 20539]ANC71051.1 osmotically inducible protein C [Deinococcus radiodurans R1 = ATCC 13939 = DSM 20539]QEM71271.1 organic hydroperoxide resistance protein [Deinococcus radiodurans]QIP29811.1 organic hydroperoxide resistance protein [Deinococcus radiodurans]QIP31511.1 organic hydroperoxide resistance protein [Deinococcus radiodura
MANVYTAEATATGGRAGTTRSSDDRLNLDLSVPAEMGGDGGPGTNPEQLFAAGYAACFQGALGVVSRRQKIDVPADSTITARVGLQKAGLAFALDVELEGHFPGLSREQAEGLMHAAHEVCPYSAATRNNVDVRLKVRE